jgi:hypothetical protein
VKDTKNIDYATINPVDDGDLHLQRDDYLALQSFTIINQPA